MKIIELNIDKIKVYGKNIKHHPPEQVAELSEMITEFKFLKPLIVDEKNELLAGHGALMAGIKSGMTKFPCVVHTHLSQRQKIAWRIADNKIAEKSIWGFENLALEVEKLVEKDFDLSLTGFNEQEIDAILKDNLSILPDDTDSIEVKAHERTPSKGKQTAKIVCVSGDIFNLDGLKIEILDPDAAPVADWIIRRMQSHTGRPAVHSSGWTFEKLEDARNKG